MEKSYSLDKNDRNTSNSIRSKRSGAVPERKLVKQSGSLEFIEDNASRGLQKSSRPPSQSSERSCSRLSFGSVPPGCDSSLGKRTGTPTKQVSLQAVRRKEESSGDLFVDHVDWRDLDSGRNSRNDGSDTEDLSETFRKMRMANRRQREDTNLSEEGGAAGGAARLSAKEMKKEEKEEDEKEIESSDDDDDDDSDDDEVKEPRKAPTELLMEFVDCLMKKDFQNADKLCKMILIYEPENPEALKFKPLIEEKIQLDEEAALESSDDDDDEDDSDEDSDDDSDDSDDSTDDSEEEDENNKEEESASAEASGSQPAQASADRNVVYRHSDQTWSTTLRDFSKPSSSKE